MCGIIGYAGSANAPEILVEAIEKLEYRGYDSAGISVKEGDSLTVVKVLGEIKNLREKLSDLSISGTIGIAHTRWATHGIPSEVNAHPHSCCQGKISLVHNGIIENYHEIKEELIAQGHTFESDTDTEVIVHLIEEHISQIESMSDGDPDGRRESRDSSDDRENVTLTENTDSILYRAVQSAVPRLVGAYALVIASADEDYLVGVREKSPLVVGRGSGENFFASDVYPLLKYTSDVIYLEDGDIVKLDKHDFAITDGGGEQVTRKIEVIDWDAEGAQKSGFEHFMLKEIYEQVESIHNTYIGIGGENINLTEQGKALLHYLPEVDTIEIVACGTSYNAGTIGKYFIEEVSGIPVKLTHASEFRYSSPVKHSPFVIAISQSGETADTLAAVREAKRRGSQTLAITNVVGSTITRTADHTFFTRAGPEIGVAATKTFTAQIIVLYMIGILMHRSQGGERAALDDIEQSLRGINRTVQKVLVNTDPIKKLASFLSKATTIFFIGRNINYPTAEEGALKLKEISYIHAEAYPAGELKHGPLALLSTSTPVIALISSDHVRDKMYSNIGEVMARSAPVIIVAEEGDEMAWRYTDMVLTYPKCSPFLSPLPISVILQLLAYYTAKEKDCSIDKPRNLAKSVTVE